MTQKENMSLNPFVRFWGVLVFCFLFLTLCILSLALFYTEPSVSVQDTVEAGAAAAEIPAVDRRAERGGLFPHHPAAGGSLPRPDPQGAGKRHHKGASHGVPDADWWGAGGWQAPRRTGAGL